MREVPSVFCFVHALHSPSLEGHRCLGYNVHSVTQLIFDVFYKLDHFV